MEIYDLIIPVLTIPTQLKLDWNYKTLDDNFQAIFWSYSQGDSAQNYKLEGNKSNGEYS